MQSICPSTPCGTDALFAFYFGGLVGRKPRFTATPITNGHLGLLCTRPRHVATMRRVSLRDEQRGIGMLVLGALGFSAMSVCVKLAGQELPVAMLVLARGVVTLVLSAAWVLHRGISPFGNNRRFLLLRGVLGTGGLACFFYAVANLPLAEATVIHYLNPILTTLVALVFLGERVDRRLPLAILASLFGTLLVTRPSVLFGHGTHLPTAGVLAALGGAVFSAFAYTTVRRLRLSDDPHVIVMYFPVVAVPATLPFAIASWKTPTTQGWLLMLGLGVATQVSQVLLTKGLAVVPAGRATTVGYVQIIFAAVWGAAIFGEIPGPLTVAGALLVIVGVLVLLRPTHRRPKIPSK